MLQLGKQTGEQIAIHYFLSSAVNWHLLICKNRTFKCNLSMEMFMYTRKHVVTVAKYTLNHGDFFCQHKVYSTSAIVRASGRVQEKMENSAENFAK